MKRISGKSTTMFVTIAMSASMLGMGLSPAMAQSHQPLAILAEESPSWQDNFNPYVLNNLQTPLGTIYESLFYFSTTGPTYPLLGTSFAWSHGDKVLTVQLRKGVKWSDGKSFSANDVVFSYNLLKRFPAADTNNVWQNISSVKAVNANEVAFTFKVVTVPFAEILLAAVPIVPQHIWQGISDPTKWTDPQPVGTGPYMLNKYSTQNFSLKANLNYWGGQPPVPVLNYPALSSNDSADMELSSGVLDWSELFVPNIKNIYVNRDSAHNHYWFPPIGDVSIYPNLKNPFLANLSVRQAISLAINRSQIDRIGEYGYESPANPTGLILPSEHQWLDASVPMSQRNFSMNVAQANALLDKAGFKKQADGIRAKNGKPLEFNLIAPAGWTDWNEDQSLIANDLQAIGIKINAQQVQQGNWQSQLQGHTFQLALESSYVITGNTPFYGYYNVLDPKGYENYEVFNNPQVTSALSQFEHSANSSVQHKAMGTIEGILAKQLPVIPLVYAANWYEYSSKNYTGWPTPANPYVDVLASNPFSAGIVLMHLKPVK